MKCPNCGAEVHGKFCEYCGSEMPREKTVTNITNKSKTVINNYYNSEPPQMTNNSFRNQIKKEENAKAQENSSFKTYCITILLFLFFYPAGLIMMWVQKVFPKTIRIIITVFFAFITICALFSSDPDTTTTTDNTYVASPMPTIEPTPEPKEFDSLQDAFKEGFEDGLGNHADESKENIEEHIEDIKESIDYILSE